MRSTFVYEPIPPPASRAGAAPGALTRSGRGTGSPRSFPTAPVSFGGRLWKEQTPIRSGSNHRPRPASSYGRRRTSPTNATTTRALRDKPPSSTPRSSTGGCARSGHCTARCRTGFRLFRTAPGARLTYRRSGRCRPDGSRPSRPRRTSSPTTRAYFLTTSRPDTRSKATQPRTVRPVSSSASTSRPTGNA